MITRRETMAMGLGVATITLLPIAATAAADDAIAAYTGGAAVTEGGVTIYRARDRGKRQHRSDFGRSGRRC